MSSTSSSSPDVTAIIAPSKFCKAISDSDIKTVITMLKEQPQLSKAAMDHDSDMPVLLWAVSRDPSQANYLIVKALVDSGADLSARTAVDTSRGDGLQTALMIAVMFNSFDVFSLLVKSGADVNAADQQGKTVLMYAAEQMFRTPFVDLLLENGANVHAKNNEGETAIMVPAFDGQVRNFDALLKAGADPDAVGSSCSAIQYAFMRQNWVIVDKLLALKVNVNRSFPDGSTALFFAAALGKTPVVQRLLSLGATVDSVNQDGQSAAIAAGQYGQKEAFELLKDAGADVSTLKYQNKTASEWLQASKCGQLS